MSTDYSELFVMESDHPQYQLRLENGVTVSTSIQELWLKSRISGMALDQDDPFAKIRKEVEHGPLKMGSYDSPQRGCGQCCGDGSGGCRGDGGGEGGKGGDCGGGGCCEGRKLDECRG